MGTEGTLSTARDQHLASEFAYDLGSTNLGSLLSSGGYCRRTMMMVPKGSSLNGALQGLGVGEIQ
jgi:hypothetical protein